MTKTLVLRRRETTEKIIKQNFSFIIISAIFIFGLLIGSFSISVCEDESFYGLDSYFNDYLTFVQNSDFSELFFNSIFIFGLLTFLNYILGLCVIGNFVSMLFLFLFSFGVGSVSGFLYNAFSLKGIGFFALTVFPSLFLFCINYLLSLKQSFNFSKELFKLCSMKNEVRVDFRAYSIKYIVHFIFVVLISLVFAFFANTFDTMFVFY